MLLNESVFKAITESNSKVITWPLHYPVSRIGNAVYGLLSLWFFREPCLTVMEFDAT